MFTWQPPQRHCDQHLVAIINYLELAGPSAIRVVNAMRSGNRMALLLKVGELGLIEWKPLLTQRMIKTLRCPIKTAEAAFALLMEDHRNEH